MSLWSSALSRLSRKVAPQNYELWIGSIECRSIEGNRILLRAPNQYVRFWFESNYLPIVLDELRHEADRDFQVEFEVVEPSGRAGPELRTAPPVVDELP